MWDFFSKFVYQKIQHISQAGLNNLRLMTSSGTEYCSRQISFYELIQTYFFSELAGTLLFSELAGTLLFSELAGTLFCSLN